MMRKIFLILLCAGLGFLGGCAEDSSIPVLAGQVTAFQSPTDSGYSPFVLLTEDGQQVGIIPDDRTRVDSHLPDVNRQTFFSGQLPDVRVEVVYAEPGSSFTTSDGKTIPAYSAQHIWIEAVLYRDALRLSDGTRVDMWQSADSSTYQLSDGTELLMVSNPSGPANVYVGGVESLDDVSESAQANILAFYEAQGLLYDIPDELEKAYQQYQSLLDQTSFNAFMVAQEIAPTASNEKVIYFLTSVMLPIDSQTGYELRLGAAFDRATGAHIPTPELFVCPADDLGRLLLDAVHITDPLLQAEMEQAFSAAHIVLFPDNLEISFPPGTLPSQEHTWLLHLNYAEALSSILHEWAVPVPRK